jgi:hypothetical protein
MRNIPDNDLSIFTPANKIFPILTHCQCENFVGMSFCQELICFDVDSFSFALVFLWGRNKLAEGALSLPSYDVPLYNVTVFACGKHYRAVLGCDSGRDRKTVALCAEGWVPN